MCMNSEDVWDMVGPSSGDWGIDRKEFTSVEDQRVTILRGPNYWDQVWAQAEGSILWTLVMRKEWCNWQKWKVLLEEIESPDQETHHALPPSLSSARVIAQDRPRTKKSTKLLKALIPSDLQPLFLIQVNPVIWKWKLHSRTFFRDERRKKCKMRVKNFSKWRLPQNQSKNIGKCKMASIFWICWNKAFVGTYTWKNFNMLWKKYRTWDRSRQERRNEKLELTEI